MTPVEVSLDAPATAVAGSELTVGWDGPDYRNDYIAISRPDDPRYETYTYTREGAPLEVTVPLEPGDLRAALRDGPGRHRAGPGGS